MTRQLAVAVVPVVIAVMSASPRTYTFLALTIFSSELQRFRSLSPARSCSQYRCESIMPTYRHRNPGFSFPTVLKHAPLFLHGLSRLQMLVPADIARQLRNLK